MVDTASATYIMDMQFVPVLCMGGPSDTDVTRLHRPVERALHKIVPAK
jgi:hypothetical protein